MAYVIAQNSGDSTPVPQIILAKLPDAKGDFVRVALYIVCTKDTDSASIAHALRLKNKAEAQRALDYWAGAGLLTQSSHASGSIDNAPSLRPARLNTAEVTTAAMTDPAIAFLVQESQRIWGRIVTQADTNILVSLYINDGLPVDMILMGLAHYGKQGKSARYVETVLLRLAAEGITTGDAMERHIQHETDCAANEARVAEIMSVPAGSFTKSERVLIDNWYSGFGYGDEMVREALGYAGGKNTVRYLNGILRTWYGKGLRTVRDVMAAGAVEMQNVQVTAATSARPDLMQNDLQATPVFKKRRAKE